MDNRYNFYLILTIATKNKIEDKISLKNKYNIFFNCNNKASDLDKLF